MWVSDEKAIREILSKWSGANAQVWEYACGHGTLLVRLFRPTSQVNLFITCGDCRTVKFPSMGWKNADLKLREKANPIQNDEDFRFEIMDGERFYAACWGVCMAETEKAVFIDWPPESRTEKENRILI